MRRVTDDRLLGGVAAGIARRFGRDVTVVRILFVIFGLPGLGLAPYFACWLIIRADGEDDTIAARALGDRGTVALAVAVGSVVALVMIVISWLGITWFNSFSWAYVVSAAGLVAVARHGSAAERQTLRRLAAPLLSTDGAERRGRVLARVAVTAVLLGAGLGLLMYNNNMHAVGTQVRALSGVVLMVAAIVVLLVPWWARMARDLVTERQGHARAEERIEMAARLHDSVLQTLALIQRRADNPQQVVQLARAQERELRGWLFGGAVPRAFDAEVTHLAAGVQRLAEEVESRHGVPVDAVTVGDAPLDKRLEALLEAAREAAVNAAKWSGAPMISVFAEVDSDTVSVYVRDRGRGFDPAAVPPDRKGLSESITARMARHGGSARIRSAPGEGAEITLVMPRVDRQPAERS
jgi:signal transduction histidine kinase/phage shock protein PspC (stress-responsive transcriptional regulator)